MKLFIKICAALPTIAAAAWAGDEYPALLLVHARDRDEVRKLTEAGLDVDTCAARCAEGVLVYARPTDFKTIRDLGFGYEILYTDGRDAVRWTDEWDGPRYAGGRAIPYDHYLSYEEFAAAMQELANNYPHITRLTSIGKTVNGRDIWALKISKNPDAEEEEPELRLVGAHHGNEKISYMVALYVTEQLCARYPNDPDVKALVDGAEIWAIPMLNADGVVANSRYNANGVDLNRNYSYQWRPGPTHGPYAFSEPETRAIRDLSTSNTFVMSHSFHSGAKYVNYLWNWTPELPKDIAEILHLSKIYNYYTGYPIINGYTWYQTFGDLNDWSYGERADPDDTIELYGPSYNPPVEQILYYCELNWPAVVHTLRPAQVEVIRGWVKDEQTHAPLAATVTPLEINWPAYTDPAQGDYYKMLRPGTYTVKASAPGYSSYTAFGVVLREGAPTTLNFYLHRTESAVRVDYFRLANRAGDVLLNWKVSNGNFAGFNIYRRRDNEPTTPTAKPLNAALITGRSPFTFTDRDVPPGMWHYDLEAVETTGHAAVIATAVINHDVTAPHAFALGAAYPNPYRGVVHIPFAVPKAGPVKIELYDLAGRVVATLVDTWANEGAHLATVDTSRLSPGVYIYRAVAAENVASRRLVVTK